MSEEQESRIDWDPHNHSGEYVKLCFSLPKTSNWQATLISNIKYSPLEGEEPNWFHRLMQRWLLGIKWEKKDG